MLVDLKERIREALQEIPLDMLHRVMRAFVHSLEECVQCNGNHLGRNIQETVTVVSNH